MGVRVKNTGEAVFRDRFNGEDFEIGPGEAAVVPEAAAKLWMGDWTFKDRLRESDERRARDRRGGKPVPLVLDTEEPKRDEPMAQITPEEDEILKQMRKGAKYVFPDGTEISKKVDALKYLREQMS